ncbi:EAL domain-containing protein [Aerophototrophica crusticola]|uniref:EAL domain-containing protein n=1 Tax=Aerophototrophica crusticola TaxID=1709002 RepID=A0A858RA12_9PROT|nr:EAL domain-containing protein [Rhodospirillaceae bacterium B3]
MNRQPNAPKRDWVRVKPGERTAAVPEKPDYDDQKLLTLLQSAKREVQGLRLIHLHMSLLKDKSHLDIMSIKRAMQETADQSAYLQVFNLSNDDAIVLYKGIKFSLISDVCSKIEKLLLSRTMMVKRNPYGEDSLYSIMELSLNFVNVIRFIEGLTKDGGADGAKQETKPPITLEELGKIERAVQMFDLSPFMLNQPVVNIRATENEFEYFELYIAVKALEERLSPQYDITANKWLFSYFTANLDNSVLKALNYGVDFLRGRRLGLNLNLSTILSAAFVKFDERLTTDLRGNVVLEINKADLVENIGMYKEVVDFAAAKGYKICIDGLNDFWVTHMDLEYMACDYAKIFWTDEMDMMSEGEYEAFCDKIRAQSNCRFVLARCGTVSGLMFAEKAGINLVQGRIVDNILRKGVAIRDAIKTAKVMSDD